jgi:hypothetical protein
MSHSVVARVQRAITKRYGPFGRLFDLYFKLSGWTRRASESNSKPPSFRFSNSPSLRVNAAGV